MSTVHGAVRRPRPRSGTGTAVVIGASMAGLTAARVLSDQVRRVVIVERDRLPVTVANRRGVPQGRHAHILLKAGELLLDGWFPGLIQELEAGGAVRTSGHETFWFQAGGRRMSGDWGVEPLSLSRPFLEHTVRRHLLARPDVTIREETRVDGLQLVDGRVVGVVAGGEPLDADLVVDCSGRHSGIIDQLAEAGFPQPRTTRITVDVGYGTVILPRTPGDVEHRRIIVGDLPHNGSRAGALLPLEGDRWILTLAGMHGDHPPTDPDGFAAFANTLPYHALARLLEAKVALTPVMTHRMPASQRRHFERLDRHPAGLVSLGDALCSFNPLYGQGMSSAALQAEALGRMVSRHGLTSAGLPRHVYRAAAAVVDSPWRIAASGDFADPRTTGPKARGTDLLNHYLGLTMMASHRSLPVAARIQQVQNLMARPSSLLTPTMAARVLWTTRHQIAASVRRRSRDRRVEPETRRHTPAAESRSAARSR